MKGHESKCIVEIMINTGVRPLEIAGPRVEHFELDGPIPLMSFLPEDRQLKNGQSLRKLPLAGVAL